MLRQVLILLSSLLEVIGSVDMLLHVQTHVRVGQLLRRRQGLDLQFSNLITKLLLRQQFLLALSQDLLLRLDRLLSDLLCLPHRLLRDALLRSCLGLLRRSPLRDRLAGCGLAASGSSSFSGSGTRLGSPLGRSRGRIAASLESSESSARGRGSG